MSFQYVSKYGMFFCLASLTMSFSGSICGLLVQTLADICWRVLPRYYYIIKFRDAPSHVDLGQRQRCQ